ncbi:hypothetical protein [Pseudomonas sp. FW300-N1A1]|uniref:hypothetical protein n=1 Tax=Pseudomonas sp. FW300-N1A1 TaxID=2075555 RepID=UPI001304E824|nr:hypothetical protein [Pseudomonas sp. FW300-N1A1]
MGNEIENVHGVVGRMATPIGVLGASPAFGSANDGNHQPSPLIFVRSDCFASGSVLLA